MSRTRTILASDLALQMEEALTELLNTGQPLPGIADEDGGVEVNVIETYAGAMLMTGNKGLVLYLSDGREVHLTITAYAPVNPG